MAVNFKYIFAVLIGTFFAFAAFLKLVVEFLQKGWKVIAGPKYRTRPKILLNPKYGKSGFLHLKDITMHFVEKGDKSKPLLLLVHGFPEFWFSWRYQLDSELADKYHIVAIDQRGYGDSDKPPSVSDYRVKLLVEDLKQAIAALGHTDCYLVGHDWGGAVAWSFAIANPEMVRKLAILNCPHPVAFSDSVRYDLDQFKKSWYMMMMQLPRFAEWLMTREDLKFMDSAFVGPEMGVRIGRIDSSEMEAFKYTFGKPDALKGPINFYRAAFRYQPNQEEMQAAKQKLKMPITLIFGDKDGAISLETAKKSSKFCENFSLQLVENASHWVQQDTPDQVNRLLLDFLD